jgi:bifunctional DNA-binding transcriptional regulator/antitoxin component of YhaV-PrlF toxin-antitoxin module
MVITIPKKLMEFSGWKEGDMLKVMARKKEE